MPNYEWVAFNHQVTEEIGNLHQVIALCTGPGIAEQIVADHQAHYDCVNIDDLIKVLGWKSEPNKAYILNYIRQGAIAFKKLQEINEIVARADNASQSQ